MSIVSKELAYLYRRYLENKNQIVTTLNQY
jgi:hypothetical protein